MLNKKINNFYGQCQLVTAGAGGCPSALDAAGSQRGPTFLTHLK